uniref:Secreted protein n=1 Tax=Heterorhabditis bacteriophora TaxID=37862 RepID=A0A1I7XF03_HETBA
MVTAWRSTSGILFAVLLGDVSCSTQSRNHYIGNCSSHCSVTNDKTLKCFNGTLKYFEKVLFTAMRNYIAIQVSYFSCFDENS